MRHVSDIEKAELAVVLKLPFRSTDKELYMAMLEASAKQLQIPKYRIYTVDELLLLVREKYESRADVPDAERHGDCVGGETGGRGEEDRLPGFVHTLIQIERDRIMDLKGRNFLTLKDFTKEEIGYLLDLAAGVKD